MPLIPLQDTAHLRSPALLQASLRWLRRAACAAAFFSTIAACGGGGGGGSTSSPSTPPAPSEPAAPTPDTHASAGCGSAAKFTTGLQSLTSDGIERSYWVEMPANYDPNKTYPVVIGLHWRGGSADEVRGWSGFFGLKNEYGNNAIFVAPQGLDAGWANSGDRDIRFMRSMISQVQQGACTDTQRVFATGFSFGGMMSNAIGCQMGDVVRAIAPMAGSLWSGCAQSPHRVAALFIHAQDDNTVPYTAGEEARNTFTSRNACSANTVPLGTNGCVEYQGCSAGKPVVWCGTPTGGHWYPSFSAKETKTFFDRFE
jgi:poly(3-hydroxybutyrate) depolymerase